MGLASGKSKLKLIDIDSSEARNSARQPRSSTSGGDHSLGSETQSFVDDQAARGQEATEIGAALREARERSGQNLEDASRNLRIRLAYLAALENGDFKSLPGMTYAVGYVRTYAQYLDLDVEKAIALFKAEARDLNGPRQLVFPSPAPEGKVPGGALMFVATFLAIFAYAGWYYVTDSGRAVAGYSLEVPEVLQSWLDEPSTSASSDGFTRAAVAASPAPTTATTGEARAPSVSVPLSETTVLTITPVLESKTPPSAVAVVSDESSAAVGDATASGPETPASEKTTANAPVETPLLETSQSAVETALIATNAAAEPETGAATPSPAPVPVAVASLSLGGNDAPGLVANSTSVPTAQVAPTPDGAPETNESMESAATQEAATSEKIATNDPAISIPSAPDMSRPMASAGAVPARQPAASTPARVVIKASAASWVQVRASDSTTIMTKVMRAGDVYEVPARDGLKLFTGNAGALTILVDGKAVRRIGKNGDVARNVDLAPETLEKQVY